MKKLLITLTEMTLAVILSLSLASCEKGDKASGESAVPALSPITKQTMDQIHGSMEEFSIDFFKKAHYKNNGSILVSPFSLAMALAMADGGAKGETSQEIRNVLGFSNITQEEMARYFFDLSQVLSSSESTTSVKIANSIWADDCYVLQKSYQSFAEAYYSARISTVDMSSESSADIINEWCENCTGGLIKNIVAPYDFTGLIKLYLFNALHFKGEWTEYFEDCDAEFQNIYGTKVKGIMMCRKGDGQKLSTSGKLSLVEIRYKDGKFAFDILVPDKGENINTVIENLTVGQWNILTDNLKNTALDLVIPKFNAQWGLDCIDNLKYLGMTSAFIDGTADFTGLTSNGRPYITKIIQKSQLDLNEKGTEAGSATGIGFAEKASLSTGTEFIVDRPFVYAIRDTESDTILFMGTMLAEEYTIFN